MASHTGIGDQDNGDIMIDRALVNREIGNILAMATGAVAWAGGGISMTIGADNQDTSACCMAVGASIFMIFCTADDVAAMASGTICTTGDATVIFALVAKFKAGGIGAVASTTVGGAANDVR